MVTDFPTPTGATAQTPAHPSDIEDLTPKSPAQVPTRTTPAERIVPERAWSMAQLRARSPYLTTLDGMDAASRLDPFYDGLWTTGASASWVSASLASRQVRAGLAKLPAPLAAPAEAALAAFKKPSGWQTRLRLLAAVDMWRTASAEQVAALTGDATLASALTAGPAAAFAGGLLDLGVFSNGLVSTNLAARGALYRPSATASFDEHLAPHLTWPEWVAVTAGQGWTGGGQYDRHNLLATELGLRFAEFCLPQVATVLGEKLSTVDLLAGSGIGRAPIERDQRSADLTVVRADGLRIAVEVTANAGQHFTNKVAKWAKLLAATPLSESGLAVVFVVAGDPDRDDDAARKRARELRTRTYQAVKAAVAEYPGSVRDRTAARIGVASWAEWFPGKALVAQDFLDMRVHTPTGPGDDVWEETEFLNPAELPFEPVESFDATAIVANSHWMLGVPAWLRDPEEAAPLWPRLVADAGLSKLPVPTPARPDRSHKGKQLGQASGAAHEAKPPKRLCPF